MSDLTKRFQSKCRVEVNQTRRTVTPGASEIEAALGEETEFVNQSVDGAIDAVLELELVEGGPADRAPMENSGVLTCAEMGRPCGPPAPVG